MTEQKISVSGDCVRAYSWKQVRRLCECERKVLQRREELIEARKTAEERAEEQKTILRLLQRKEQTEILHRRVERRARAMEEAAGVTEHLGRITKETAVDNRTAGDVAEDRRRRITRMAPGLRQERIIVEDLRAMLARERGRVTTEIQQIFPIELCSDVWTICGLRVERIGFPASEETAAALGIVAWILEYVSRGLGVPLRFPSIARASRSAMVTPVSSVVWPLHIVRNADRPRQRMAQRLLAVDIEQLLWLFGITDVDRRALLPNVTQLLMAIEASSFAP